MTICKEAAVQGGGVPTPQQLEKINLQSKAALTAEQVYCFSVQLCNDQPDRDFERFDTGALEELARMFVGRTGICDHQWSAGQQVARIFDTAVEDTGGVSSIRAWAYMLRGEKNDAVIADIEGGIRREVSVGCAMGRTTCSICGADYGSCEHRKGQHYAGQLCVAVLSEPKDAYEFSFVAVPAQPEAGVLKGYGHDATLRQLAAQFGTARRELEELEQAAQAGRDYLAGLREQAVRLCLGLSTELSADTLQAAAAALDAAQLRELCAALDTMAQSRYPGTTQLPGGSNPQLAMEPEFLI